MDNSSACTSMSPSELIQLRDQLHRAAIRDAIDRHFHGLDSRRYEDVFLSAYTEDVTFAVLDGEVVGEGHDALLDLIRGGSLLAGSHHAPCNISIELDGESATSVTYALAYLAYAPDREPLRVAVRGLEYRHQWRLTAGGWRSYRLVQRPRWQVDLPTVDPAVPLASHSRAS